MIRAYSAIDCAAGTARDVCERIRAVDGVTEAHVVAGDFDVVAELEGESPQDLLRTISSEVRPLEGVGTTRTYICID